jgi:hypothetical protein
MFLLTLKRVYGTLTSKLGICREKKTARHGFPRENLKHLVTRRGRNRVSG